ncbi:hypothetical protein [uncultured Sunxiuqinia sp.]|uniref:hypothetical protein n=1 Tax=uncultured Sunxiuqinia sp. TaxID=1573825 RepID=UPI002AA5E33D|nr:hypothetical protein [uncultured Sunxiuqinia sp.]
MKLVSLCLKKYTMLVIIVCFSNGLVLASNSPTNEEERYRKIIDSIEGYFTEALKSTYSTDVAEEAYISFMNSYFNTFVSSDGLTNFHLNLTVDDRVKEITKELMTFNQENGYCLFPDFRYVESEDKVEELRSSTQSPNVVYVYSHAYSSEEDYYEKLNKRHSVSFAREVSCFEKLDPVNTLTSKVINEQMDYTGEVGFLNLAALYIKGNAKDELANPEVQRIISVIFWKLICAQSGVKFRI